MALSPAMLRAAPEIAAQDESRFPPKASLILCATPRSGSTLLCAALADTGLAGRPDEYFSEQPDAMARLQAQVGAPTPDAYLERLTLATATGDGVFSTKLFAHQAPILERHILMSVDRGVAGRSGSFRANLGRALGDVSFIWLRRRNLHAQAISYYRAAVTGQWTHRATDGAAPAPAYDERRLRLFRNLLAAMDREWAGFFRRLGLRPLVLTYEDLSEDLGRDVGLVLDYAGVRRPEALHCPRRLERQADEASIAWERRSREAEGAIIKARAGDEPGRLCLICRTPGADAEALAEALYATGLVGGLSSSTGAGREEHVLDRAAAGARATGVSSMVLSAADVQRLRAACGQAFGAPEAPGMPLAMLIGAWGLRPLRIALRWRDPQLQAAAIYRRRHWKDGAASVDPEAFAACLNLAASARAAWRPFFVDENMETLEVFLEDLEQFPSTSLNAILTFCRGAAQDLAFNDSLRCDFSVEREILERLSPASRDTVPAAPDEAAAPAPEPEAAGPRQSLIAYGGMSDLPLPVLAPAAKTRAWMEAQGARFAYRCLPMVIANQAGWLVLSAETVRARWTGGAGTDSVIIRGDGGGEAVSAQSTFGLGILTFVIPYLFRSSRGANLLVRGPANEPRDGIFALEGMVETDQTEAPFTINWMFTRPDVEVCFAKGEPIAMIVPTPRGYLESFEPEFRSFTDDPALQRRNARWMLERVEFKANLLNPAASGVAAGDWQKAYMRGRDVDGDRFAEHQTALKLKPFRSGG